jgi:hypothetical protein
MSAGTTLYLTNPMARDHIQTNYCIFPTLKASQFYNLKLKKTEQNVLNTSYIKHTYV